MDEAGGIELRETAQPAPGGSALFASLDEDEPMRSCRRWAWDAHMADNTLSYEQVAHRLGEFLGARIMEQPDTAERAALLSVVSSLTRTATYFSSGRKAIYQAMTLMMRLALPYREHSGWHKEWAA